ncbi:MAG: hypothetical protein RLO08_02250 [Parvibaculaceae bacterium]
MTSLDTDKALKDPASAFKEPEEILKHTTLTAEQKVNALRRWAYDAREKEVAEEEGMTGGNGDVLQRIMIALDTLGYPLDEEHTAPTKQSPSTG